MTQNYSRGPKELKRTQNGLLNKPPNKPYQKYPNYYFDELSNGPQMDPNGLQMDFKWTPNRPKWTQNGPKMTPNDSKLLKGAIKNSKGPKMDF